MATERAGEPFDVAVVGGGSAGVAAALAAARCGARTLLLEASDRLGGNASLAQVHTICGLYHPADDGPVRPAHTGLAAEIEHALRAAGGAGTPERAGRVHYLPIDPDVYARHLRETCEAEPRLEFHLGHELAEARAVPGGVRLGAASGTWEASLAIDASGAAHLAERLGAARRIEGAEVLQCPSYIVELEGVETDALEGFARLQVTAALAKAARDARLPEGAESVVVRPAIHPGRAFLTFGVAKDGAGTAYDPLDASVRGRLEVGARGVADAVVAHLRETREAFAQARVRSWPARLGVREAGRGRTRIELDAAAVLEGVRRDDEVALSTWPIELWRDHRRARFDHPKSACGVPLGALIGRDDDRLAFAGRCMGGTHEALGALRVIGTAWATGQAAGVAAALAAEAGVGFPQVDPADVRKRLVDPGMVRRGGVS